MKISVTQSCIDKGAIQDGDKCMVALAFKRAGVKDAFVGHSQVVINYMKDNEKHISLPAEVRENIEAFDNGKEVEPFEFEIAV